MAATPLWGRHIVVTGATGFLGPALCRTLVDRGAMVHGVSQSVDPGMRDGIHWHRADLSDLSEARDLLAAVRPELVYHLAGLGKGGPGLELVLPTFRSNVVTTVNLLTVAAEGSQPHVIVAGSMEEPRDPGEIPFSPYAMGKWASSAYARMFHRLFELPVTVARIFMAYGPGHQDERKLFPYIIRSILRGEVPQLSSGSRLIDWIYIDDVIDGLVRTGEVEATRGRTVDLGSGELLSVKGMVEHLVEVMDSPSAPRFGDLDDRPSQEPRIADTAGTFALMGWQPRTPRSEGLRRTVRWHKERLLGAGHGPT